MTANKDMTNSLEPNEIFNVFDGGFNASETDKKIDSVSDALNPPSKEHQINIQEIKDRKDNISDIEETSDEYSSSNGIHMYDYSLSKLNNRLIDIKKKKMKPRFKLYKTKSELHPDKNISQSYEDVEHIKIKKNPDIYIYKLMREIQIRVSGHTKASTNYTMKEKRLGFPVTILSSLLSSTILLSMSTQYENATTKLLSLILSFISFILSITRNYCNYAVKSHSHDMSAKLYTTLLRQSELKLMDDVIGLKEKKELFKDLSMQISIIEQYETPIPNWIEIEIRSEIEDDII